MTFRHLLLLAACLAHNCPATVAANDVKTDVKTVVQTGHNAIIHTYDISPNGRYILSFDKERKTCVWDIPTGRQIYESYDFYSGQPVNTVSFHKRRSDWLILNSDEISQIVDIKTNRRIGMVSKDDAKVKSHANNAISVEAEGNDLVVKDRASQRMLARLGSEAGSFTDLKVVDGGKRLLVNGFNLLVCWDLSLANVEFTVPLNNNQAQLTLTNDSSAFLTAEADALRMRDIRSGRILKSYAIPEEAKWIRSMAYDDEGNLLIGAERGLYQIPKGSDRMKLIHTDVEGYKDSRFDRVFFDPYGREFLLTTCNCWSVLKSPKKVTGKFTKGFFADNIMYDMRFREDAVVLCGDYRNTSCYRRENEKKRTNRMVDKQILGQFINRACCFLGPDVIASGNSYGDLQIFDINTHAMLHHVREHKNQIMGLETSPCGRFFYTSSLDGTVCVWNTADYSLVAKLVYFKNDNNYAVVTSDNYFAAPKRAFSGIHFQKGLEVFSFDQFDIRYNRPDLVIDRLGYGSPKRIEMLRKVHEMRLKRLGFDPDATAAGFNIPTLDITNAREIAYEQPDGSISLKLSMKDANTTIDRLFVRVNGVPTGGSKGIPLADRRLSEIQDEISVELVEGENLVEVSCLNADGAESYRKSVKVLNSKQIPLPDLYVLAIGAGKYRDSGFNLTYPGKDASDIAAMLSAEKNRFSNVKVNVLADEDVTQDRLRQAAEWLRESKIHDTVVLFYAGHGVLTEDYEQYLATYDMDFSNPRGKGISYYALEDALAASPAVNKLMLIDACHSGYIDRESVASLAAAPTKKGAVSFRSTGSALKMKTDDYKDIVRLCDELFSDAQKDSGATIIASASGMEVALEGDSWNNGLFTSAFLDGIEGKKADANQDGDVRVSEIQSFVADQVSRLSNGEQRPNARTENKYQDFILSR